MNNKGQVFITMILLIPLLLLAIGCLIESSYLYYQKHHITSITKTIIAKNIEEKNENDIINMYDSNNITYDSIEVIKDNGLEIKLNVTINSIFKSLISKDDYKIYIDIKGIKDNNKIEYKKG